MKKLIIFDMDGIIFKHSNFWLELHKAYGTYKEGIKLTTKYVKTDYQKLVNEVVGRLWKEKPAKVYFNLINKSRYITGAKTTFKKLKEKKYKIGIVSSGPSHLAQRLKEECNIDYYFTNELLIKKGKIVGSTDIKYWPIRYGSKKDPLKEICNVSNTKLEDTITIVHDENDIEMAKESGYTIGFYPVSKELEKHCDIIINTGKPDLRKILKYLN